MSPPPAQPGPGSGPERSTGPERSRGGGGSPLDEVLDEVLGDATSSADAPGVRLDFAGTLALVTVVVAWSITPVFLRALTSHLDSFTANGIRYPLAALCYWPVLWWFARRGQLTARVWKAAIVPAIFSVVGQIFFAWSPYFIEASAIGFLVKMSVLWAIFGALVLFPEERRIVASRRFQLGLLLAIGGLVGLAVAQNAFAGGVTGIGFLMMLGCSFGYGSYGVSVRQFFQGVHPVLAFAVTSQFVSVLLLVALAVSRLFTSGEGGPEIPGLVEVVAGLSGEAWALILVSTFVGIATTHTLYYVAIQRLGPTLSTSAHFVGPFITLATASVFLGESMSPAAWTAGVVLVLGGLILVLAQSRRR